MDADAIRELARTRFGFSELRPGQLRAVSAAADGRDVLAVLPTGGGKSAIYELAGLLRPGPTVVVSPLIALQDDQVAHLRAAGLTAIVLNSHQSAREHVAALAEASEPDAFVFLSPEQLANGETREALRRAQPGLFAVDEAHLISQWGHDFRTDYMRLSAQADVLEVPVRMALTATASEPVRREITRRLGLRDPEVVVGDFDRPHIELSARAVRTLAEKHEELVSAADELDGPGMVYAATHAEAEAARDVLAAAGQRVTLYHAGLGPRVTARGDDVLPRRLDPHRRRDGCLRDGHRQAGRALGAACRPAAVARCATTRRSAGPAGTRRLRTPGSSTGRRTSAPPSTSPRAASRRRRSRVSPRYSPRARGRRDTAGDRGPGPPGRPRRGPRGTRTARFAGPAR